MKKVLLSMFIAFSAAAMVIPEADARRLGGGGSSGRQSSNVGQSAPAQRSATPPTAPAAAPAAAGTAGAAAAAKPSSPLRGILGGALLGLGLGALMSHLGLGGMLGGILGSVLMIALLGLVAMFIYRMFNRNRNTGNNNGLASAKTGFTPATASYGGTGSVTSGPNVPLAKSSTPEIGSGLPSGYGSPAASAASAAQVTNAGTWTIPADFDVAAFTRSAKTYFVRLQAAWDKADLDDIREFTTTEMFAEFRVELQDRGTAVNVTDVVKLDAEVLGVETIGDDYLASVRFTGLIKEDPAADATQFAEVWNLSKPVNGKGGWVLAGIQQLS